MQWGGPSPCGWYSDDTQALIEFDIAVCITYIQILRYDRPLAILLVFYCAVCCRQTGRFYLKKWKATLQNLRFGGLVEFVFEYLYNMY